MKHLDKPTLKQVLNETNGSVKKAKQLLQQAGYDISSLVAVHKMVQEDPELAALVNSSTPVKSEPPTTEDVAKRVKPPAVQSIEDRDKAMADGMRGAGFDDERIEKFSHFSDFVQNGFNKTVDATYGILIDGVMDLQDRAKWIAKNILDDEDTYTDEQKLLWQKEYTSIMSEIGKYATITNNAALIRIKAINVANGGKPDNREKKLRRLKRKDDASTYNVEVAPAA